MPKPAPMPDHAELRSLVDQCEEEIRAAWARRHDDQAVVVLCDARRPEVRKSAEQFWGAAAAPRIAEMVKRCERDGGRPMVAYLQPPCFIDGLARSNDFSQREAAKELRDFAATSGFLGTAPLLVVFPGGLWATTWARPDSKTVVVRYEPDTPADAN